MKRLALLCTLLVLGSARTGAASPARDASPTTTSVVSVTIDDELDAIADELDAVAQALRDGLFTDVPTGAARSLAAKFEAAAGRLRDDKVEPAIHILDAAFNEIDALTLTDRDLTDFLMKVTTALGGFSSTTGN